MKKVLALVSLFLLIGSFLSAQTISSGSGAVRGSVVDPSGGVIKGATVSIANPVSQYNRTTQTDALGNFEFDNVPFNNYHASASAPNFQTGHQDLNIRSSVPIELKLTLKLGAASESVTVSETGGDLIETDPSTHTDIDRALFDKLPLERRRAPSPRPSDSTSSRV